MRSSIGTSSAGERRIENAGDMQRLALRAVLDLMTAARAVGADQRVGRRGAPRGQQRQLAHLQRYVRGIRRVAERAGPAAAARLYCQIGNTTCWESVYQTV